MTDLLKVKEHHLPTCLGCHNFVETMKIANHRAQAIERTSGKALAPRDGFIESIGLFNSVEETIGSAGITIAEGAMLYHWWKNVNKGHLLITESGDGTISKLMTSSTTTIESWKRREVYLMSPNRRPQNEEIGEWIKFQNDQGGQNNRIKWIQGDPLKIIFMEPPPSTRKIYFSMVYIPSTENIVEITKQHWNSLESGSMGDYETTSEYASIAAEGGMMAFRNYEIDDNVTQWVNDLTESGHAGMLDRADSVVILGKIHSTLEGV